MINETKTRQNRKTGRFTLWIGQERMLNVQTTKKARANRAKVQPFFTVTYATL